MLAEIKFSNGWTIHLHEIKNGEAYYQKWRPGVERQGIFDGLERKPEEEFWEQVKKHGGEQINLPCRHYCGLVNGHCSDCQQQVIPFVTSTVLSVSK